MSIICQDKIITLRKLKESEPEYKEIMQRERQTSRQESGWEPGRQLELGACGSPV